MQEQILTTADTRRELRGNVTISLGGSTISVDTARSSSAKNQDALIRIVGCIPVAKKTTIRSRNFFKPTGPGHLKRIGPLEYK
jgi:hypothetical protein